MGPPPVVTGISPKEGPPGTRVTIRGEFLGTTATDLIGNTSFNTSLLSGYWKHITQVQPSLGSSLPPNLTIVPILGLKICGCDCLLSAEWKSKNKIVARSGPCKGRGDIIVTTRSGGEGTSTVQFRGYHESIGPVKESAVWVEEAAPVALPWGRRPLSPAAYSPPDPLGLSTEGEDCKFPEEELHELFPDGSGKLSDENFQPSWYLLEHHSNTSFEDLKAGMVFLQRKVESQKEGQLSFLKANTGAVMDQLDRLVLLKNMFEEDQRKNGKEPLPTLKAAIEESISLADSLFSEILSRKENADKTREALSLLTRHKFLFQLPASIDRNIRKKEYDLVVNDYTRVKNLFGNTDVKLFQKILAEIDKKIEDLKEKLFLRMQTMPINVQDQTKYIRLLISLNWEGDAAWTAIESRHTYLIDLMKKVKDYFQKKEDHDSDKGKRKSREPDSPWSGIRSAWCGALCGALSGALGALWRLARRYCAKELGGEPHLQARTDRLKEMILTSIEQFCTQMRSCLMSCASNAGSVETGRVRMVNNLGHLREAYRSLLGLDLPSQPLTLVEKVIFEYRVFGITAFLQRAHKKVKGLADKETWKIYEFTECGAITNLPHQLESAIDECLSSIHKCVLSSGRRERNLFDAAETVNTLQAHIQQTLLAYVNVLKDLALEHADEQDFNNTSLSVALEQRVDDNPTTLSMGWQQRLLVCAANCQYTRRVTLANVAALFHKYGLPPQIAPIDAATKALKNIEGTIAETYLEHKGDPLVGTIEPSMFMGQHKTGAEIPVTDVRPYVYEIINNLIAVHAEVDAVCGAGVSRYLRDITLTVMEELRRLAERGQTSRLSPADSQQLRLEYTLLQHLTAEHLTDKAESYLMEALAALPPLESAEEKKHLDKLIEEIKKRMELQIACLNCNMQTV